MAETVESPKLTGNMFLFDSPELMNKESHGKLGFQAAEKNFSYCAKARAIPITVSEIMIAMKDYPIIFLNRENPAPLAVMGIVDEVNLFVDEDGKWETDKYIPGYVRRYPFGVASEDSGERLAIVIDTAYEGLKEGGEFPLFENDEPSASTQQAIEFCKAFEQDRIATNGFGERLNQLELIQGQSAQFTPQGAEEQKTFAEYFGVDEKKLQELSDEQFLELRKAGILPLIYAMMISMSNWRILLQRRARRFNMTETDILNRVDN
ncbi:MAG: SapC family protein [Alphaproteobacteria bacterium]|nr:SapC family protein [Alphaproteobacteria bacterium]